MGHDEALHKHVLGVLTRGGMDRSQIDDLVREIKGLQGNNLKISKILTKGTPPYPWAVEVRSVMDQNDIGNLGSILKGSGAIRGVEIFPLGIVAPDMFDVRISL